MRSGTVLVIFSVLTLLCLAVSIFFSIYYSSSMPRTPDPAAGRIFPLNVHGTIVYLTKSQHLLTKWSFWIGFYAGLSALTVKLIFKK